MFSLWTPNIVFLTPKEIIRLDKPLSYKNVVKLRVKAARKLDIIQGP